MNALAWALTRLVLVVGVLAGPSAMHGLAPAHADPATMAAVVHAAQPAVPISPAGHPQAGHPSTDFRPAAAATGRSDHPMLASCLLALTAALVLALVLPRVRRLSRDRPDWPPAPRLAAPRPGPRPARRAPGLFDLCVLRL